MLDTSKYTPRLKAVYRETIRSAMKEEFGYKNPMEVPAIADGVIKALKVKLGDAVSEGAVIAVLYLRTNADVTLFWPAAGIGYAAVLRYGLKFAPTIAIAQLLLHLFVVPVPDAFMLFSVASNAVATVLACAYVQSRRRQLQFRINDGLLLLRGGLLLGAISAGIANHW